MRAASLVSAGFSSRCSSTTTIVSAPTTASLGCRAKTASVLSRASRCAQSSGDSPSSGFSGMFAGSTVKVMPALRSSWARRGEAEARMSMPLHSTQGAYASFGTRGTSEVGMGTSARSHAGNSKLETRNSFGATLNSSEAEFRVWAPAQKSIKLRLISKGGGVNELPMQRDGDDFVANVAASAGDRYWYVLDDGLAVPDPVSRYLPEGVHGPTEIVDPAAFCWTDSSWCGLDLRDYIIYELHIGTFTPEGMFESVIGKLEYLKQLGITVIEIMPVAAFPGRRDWGYDGVSPYAVQASYGGPQGLKRLVDAAHGLGLGMMLDVVYNHLGPEGNYLPKFGPYFTAHHKTPWGDAINYDSEGCEQVRRYVVENALYWIREYHLDGLRLDAVQTIKDDSPCHIIAEMQDKVQALARELNRKVCVIAETDENDPRHVKPRRDGGYGLDAVWSDDFH